MLAESQRLETQINKLSSQLSKFPDGQFFCCHNGKYTKWYKQHKKKQIYIPKKNRKLAEQLATKKYLILLQKDLLREKKAIDSYLSIQTSEELISDQLFINNPEYLDLISPQFIPTSKKLLDWMNSPYEKNMQHPEHLIHKTSSGIYVRSKSEAMIAMVLHRKNIPYRYECILQLGDVTLFPDFTIRHPKSGKTYHWEHFGLMDDAHYCKNACSKLQLYASYGIIPSMQLITTYETKENPLSYEMVEKIVEYYFE